MAFTYTDSDKVVLEAWGKFKVTLLEAVESGDLLSFYNASATYAVQFADQSDSQRADCIAVDGGAAGAEITACLKAVLGTISTIATGGVVTRVYFATSTDYLGAPLYLGEDGKPSSTNGTTYSQRVGKLIARDQIAIDLRSVNVQDGGFIADEVALVPNSTRADMVLSIGSRATEKNITMVAAATQHLDPIQLNLNIIGANPTGSSTINGVYQLITHDTTDMSYLRLKNADWNIVIGKDILDAYCYQGEIDFTTAAVTVGGEAAVLGLVMNAGSYDITGNLRGLIISMQGAGMHATAIGLEIRTTCGHALGTGLAEGIRISGTPLPIVGIAMGNQTNDNEGPQNAFFFPSIGGADEGPCVASGTAQGAITILIGAATRYIRFWTTA